MKLTEFKNWRCNITAYRNLQGKKCGFNDACCDWANVNLILVMWSSVCKIFIYFVFTSHCECVYSFRPREQLITEHITCKAMLKTSVTSKLLWTQKKLDIVKKEEDTDKVLAKRNHRRTGHLCQPNKWLH
jgi:hypothetical protein